MLQNLVVKGDKSSFFCRIVEKFKTKFLNGVGDFLFTVSALVKQRCHIFEIVRVFVFFLILTHAIPPITLSFDNYATISLVDHATIKFP